MNLNWKSKSQHVWLLLLIMDVLHLTKCENNDKVLRKKYHRSQKHKPVSRLATTTSSSPLLSVAAGAGSKAATSPSLPMITVTPPLLRGQDEDRRWLCTNKNNSMNEGKNGTTCFYRSRKKKSKHAAANDDTRLTTTTSPLLEKASLVIPPSSTYLKSLAKTVLRERKKCRHSNNSGFKCQRLKMYLWLVDNLDKPSTSLTSWLELIRNDDLVSTLISPIMIPNNNNSIFSVKSSVYGSGDAENNGGGVGLLPESWGEERVFNLFKRWGDPIDLFFFYKYKEFIKSREVKLKVIPNFLEVTMSPKSQNEDENSSQLRTMEMMGGAESQRFFWDPGFNLKLKLPFFKDELKVAVSTGPAFMVGIGAGMILLVLNGLMAPFLFGMKWLVYNLFWKGGSPLDLMRMAWGGSHGPEPWESAVPPPAVEQYEPHNQYDNSHIRPHPYRPPPQGGPPSAPSAPGYGSVGWNTGGDQKYQYSHLSPLLQNLVSAEGDRRQNYYFKSLLSSPEDGGYGTTGSGGDDNSLGGGGQPVIMGNPSDSSQSLRHQTLEYVPSNALQAEVENYDPYYSPLLSRIDSIFTHLGYVEEGCRERAVCSIYKFPVKYSPYSNLLSAQLSKHQSELKKPVTKSPKVLRFFRYMKAAKDGQGQTNCLEKYPNCEQDTDSVTNLPMITTFNQLSELMGGEGDMSG